MFKSKIRTIVVAFALTAGVLGAAPVAGAALAVPPCEPQLPQAGRLDIPQGQLAGIGIPQKHPGIIAVVKTQPKIIAVLRSSSAGLDFPPGPDRSH